MSNSSSSSFLIYGTDRLNGLLSDEELENVDEIGYEDVILKKINNIKTSVLGVFGAYDCCDMDDFFLGSSPKDCPDDMTMGEFKKKIEDEVEKLFGEKRECRWHEQAWYDG